MFLEAVSGQCTVAQSSRGKLFQVRGAAQWQKELEENGGDWSEFTDKSYCIFHSFCC